VLPGFEPVATFRIEVGAPVEVGPGRRMVPVLGGTVEGARLNGLILPGGADWQSIGADELLTISARWILQTGNGARILVETPGLRRTSRPATAQLSPVKGSDPAAPYFRVAPRFSTTEPEFAWLQQSLFVGLGVKASDGVEFEVFALL